MIVSRLSQSDAMMPIGRSFKRSSSWQAITLLLAPIPLLLAFVLPVGAQQISEPAASSASPDDTSNVATVPDLDDMTGLNDIGLDWPDLLASETDQQQSAGGELPADPNLSQPVVDGQADVALSEEPSGTVPPAPLTAAATMADVIADGVDGNAELAYQVNLIGIDAIADSQFRERFAALSALRQGEGRRANLAQLRRRIRTDQELLTQLMRTRGYYDSQIAYRVTAEALRRDAVRIALVVEPGPLYLLDDVTLAGLSETDPRENTIRDQFTVVPGDPIDADRIVAAEGAVRAALAEGGYPFATVAPPQVRVDHETTRGSVAMAVETGGYRRFGKIIVEGDAPPFDARHTAVIARFEPGQPYAGALVADLNRAIVATGLISSVDIAPRPGATDELVDIAVTMTPAPYRTVAGEIGYGTGEGFRAEASWQHRNLLPPEGAVTVRGVAGTQEQSFGLAFRRNNTGGRDRAFNANFAISNLNQPAYDARTIDLGVNLERQTNLIFQKAWAWSLGGQLLLTDEQGFIGRSQVEERRTFYIAALPLSLAYDGSDNLLDPEKGFRISGRVSPEVSLQDGAFTYVRAQIDSSAYVKATPNIVFAGRLRIGTILGADRDRIAPSRRFYAGGGSSVRGFTYQGIGPTDINGDPLGGRSLTEVAVEARFRFGAQRQFGIVPFIDAGDISTSGLPRMGNLRVGAGIGARYYSNFGPIRIDVGTPLGRRPGEPLISVAVSLGQAF